MHFFYKIKDSTIEFNINSKFYPLEHVLNTSYIFLDNFFIFLDGDPKSKIKVFLKSKEKISREKLKATEGEFNNELLNQALRLNIVKNNKKIQEYIVGQALFGASIKPPTFFNNISNEKDISKIIEHELKILEKKEKENGRGDDDPLGIMAPWKRKIKNAKRAKN